MVFIRDQPAKLLIRISKQGNKVIPMSRLGKGIYYSNKSTVETIGKFVTAGLVTLEKKGKIVLVKLNKRGLEMCKILFDIKTNFGEEVICYERKNDN
jgi:hypothetical protein